MKTRVIIEFAVDTRYLQRDSSSTAHRSISPLSKPHLGTKSTFAMNNFVSSNSKGTLTSKLNQNKTKYPIPSIPREPYRKYLYRNVEKSSSRISFLTSHTRANRGTSRIRETSGEQNFRAPENRSRWVPEGKGSGAAPGRAQCKRPYVYVEARGVRSSDSSFLFPISSGSSPIARRREREGETELALFPFLSLSH